jgi:hypothetical protein
VTESTVAARGVIRSQKGLKISGILPIQGSIPMMRLSGSSVPAQALLLGDAATVLKGGCVVKNFD